MATIIGKYMTSIKQNVILEIKKGSNPQEFIFIIIVDGKPFQYPRTLTFNTAKLEAIGDALKFSYKKDFSVISFFNSPNIDLRGDFKKIK